MSRLFELWDLFFFAAFAAVVACGGVYVCASSVYASAGSARAYGAAARQMQGIEATHRNICWAASFDSLERGDSKRLHARDASGSDLTRVYDVLKTELHPDNNLGPGRIPDDIAAAQFACITAAYTRITTRLQTRRAMPSCLERCAHEKARGDSLPSVFYRQYCVD